MNIPNPYSIAGSGLAALPPAFAPDEAVVTQLQDMGFTRGHILEALNATQVSHVRVTSQRNYSVDYSGDYSGDRSHT